jgi:hypothetical protein
MRLELPVVSAGVHRPATYCDWEYLLWEVPVSDEDWDLAAALSDPIDACDCEDGYCACEEECER